MVYKYTKEDNSWTVGNQIHFPDGVSINKDNQIERDGWSFHSEPPIEYLEWLEEQEKIDEEI